MSHPISTTMPQNHNIHVKPPGFEAIHGTIQQIYEDQQNPLQVTAMIKYWLGGPDPLDYISMYSNKGDPSRGIPPHWHYVSFGLSDLHGDGRVHEPSAGMDGPSGFGFELTFRLKREPGETGPPTWPATLMQTLARYVFSSENQLCSGDHVPWHTSLDTSESRIQHMIMSEDAQLPNVTTPFGTVCFVQIVGVCEVEMKAAQWWNGAGVLELIRCVHVAGGPWLVTDMRRGETIFEMDPSLQERVDRGVETEGSNLSGVSSRCCWEEHLGTLAPDQDNDPVQSGLHDRRVNCDRRSSSDSTDKPRISLYDTEQIKATLARGLSSTKPPLPPKAPLPPISRSHRSDQLHLPQDGSRKASFDSCISGEGSLELSGTRILESVNLIFNQEAAELLPLAIRGRLKHGRHFTFKSILNDVAITLVTANVAGAIVSESSPYAAHGMWLQVLLPDDFLEIMLFNIEEELCAEMLPPRILSWPDRKLTVTIVADDEE